MILDVIPYTMQHNAMGLIPEAKWSFGGWLCLEDDPKVIHVPETVPKNWPLIYIFSLKVT